LDPMGRNRPNLAGVGTVLWGELITTPWERARAARANRSYALAAASIVAREPWHRPFGGITNPSGLAGLLATVVESTPLMKRLLPNIEPFLDADDRNEVARRALVQVLAIRAWQLRHGGRFPDRLEVLVPEELPSLPADPFSGQGFRYSTQAQSTQIEPSSWVKVAFLASVGPVRLGARSGAIFPGPAARSQLVFPIPPLQQDAGADTR
ncbi:MAG TPA: hypothetical protein VFF52_06300, partial [Isosphaeraceae bacterium]|nr:hypothetical protein [Isosphaeraceae bacterium]